MWKHLRQSSNPLEVKGIFGSCISELAVSTSTVWKA